MEYVLIFPHQLFEKHPGLKKGRRVVLVEDPRFFSDYRFHQKKLIFLRSALKHFESLLRKRGYQTDYVVGEFEGALKKCAPSALYFVELDDRQLEQRMKPLAKRLKCPVTILPSPGFLASRDDFSAVFQDKTHFHFETFYIHQRKRWDLLLDGKGKPLGGKWSMDSENRKKMPRSVKAPEPIPFRKSSTVKEAIAYVEKAYPGHPGNGDGFNYPVTHADAKKALADFLKRRLCLFGDYEDAIVAKGEVLFHSCLSPLLNVGLLTPQQVVEETLKYHQAHPVPLNSLEGFLRQVVGWREFIRGVYHAVGEKERRGNFFGHKRKLPRQFYEGTTGIVPIDETIKKLHKSAYLHHIERLMVIGNFFLLCEIDPDEVYRWFMELFIDAYDWVMVPNVYGMSQYADGGMMTSKPYFSGSNYILKMSDYPKGAWCEVWDALFWRFMIKHLPFFEKQPRLSVLCAMARKKKGDRRLLKIADSFLKF
jgi:deoxyribodipyrimidine photolyase-related protein